MFRYGLLVFLIAMLGCTKTLQLNITNPDETPYTLRYNIRREGQQPTLRDEGTIDAKKGKAISDDFDKGTTVSVQARRQNYVFWESPEYYLDKDRTDILSIDTSGIRRVDPVRSAKDLLEEEKKFKELITAKGYRPIINVLNTDFGAFVAKRKDSGDWFTIAGPDTYGGKKDLNWLKANVGSSAVRIQRSVVMNRDSTASASGGVTIFHVKGGYTDQDLYEYGLIIDIVTVSHEDTFASAKAKLSLSEDAVAKKVNAELDKFIADKNYVVAFVRGIHYFNEYSVSYRTATKVSLDSKMTIGSFLDSSGAYKFENAQVSEDKYKDQVGGFFYEAYDSIVDPTKKSVASSKGADAMIVKTLPGKSDYIKIGKEWVPVRDQYKLSRDVALDNSLLRMDIAEDNRPKENGEM